MYCNKGAARTPELCCLRFSWCGAAEQARLTGESGKQKALPTEPSWLRCLKCWPVWLSVSHFPLPSGVCPEGALISPSRLYRNLLNLKSSIPADFSPGVDVGMHCPQKICALLLFALLHYRPAGSEDGHLHSFVQ